MRKKVLDGYAVLDQDGKIIGLAGQVIEVDEPTFRLQPWKFEKDGGKLPATKPMQEATVNREIAAPQRTNR